MASVQLQKTTDKCLSQGYYGGNKYQNDIGHMPYNGGGGGHGNGYGNSHMNNGFGQAQAAYGSNHQTSHGSGHHGNGYGGYSSGHHAQGAFGSNHHTTPGKHHGSGNGFWGCDGTNGLGNLANHGMQHSPLHHGGGHLSGHMMKPQANGHHSGGQMGYGTTQSSETSEYSQVYYSNESYYNGGGRGHRTGRDSDSDDGWYRRKTVVVSKAL